MKLLVDGREAATVSALDRGLQYGDGLFETVAIRDGRPRLLPYHFDRLEAGCVRLGFEPPTRDVLERDIEAVAGASHAVAKVIVTRGAAGRGYRPPAGPAVTRIVAAFPWPEHPPEAIQRGVRTRTCRTRIGTSPSLAGLKHLGRLEQVLARAEWRDASVAEGLMLDEAGAVIGGTQSNVFVVRDGCLLTPRLDRCGVAGVMRRAVLQWAAQRCIVSRETRLRETDLLSAEEVFLTNALIGAWPVAELDGRLLRRGALAAEFVRWLDAS